MKRAFALLLSMCVMSSAAFAVPDKHAEKDKFKTMPALNESADKMNERAVANKAAVDTFITAHQDGGKPEAPPALNPSAEKAVDPTLPLEAAAEDVAAADSEKKPDDAPKGWSMGEKKGWNGLDMPPGLAKKQGDASEGESASAENNAAEAMPDTAVDAIESAEEHKDDGLSRAPDDLPAVDPVAVVEDHAPDVTDGIPDDLPELPSAGIEAVETTPAAGIVE